MCEEFLYDKSTRTLDDYRDIVDRCQIVDI